LAADGITFVVIMFSPMTSPGNPTPANCQSGDDDTSPADDDSSPIDDDSAPDDDDNDDNDNDNDTTDDDDDISPVDDDSASVDDDNSLVDDDSSLVDDDTSLADDDTSPAAPGDDDTSPSDDDTSPPTEMLPISGKIFDPFTGVGIDFAAVSVLSAESGDPVSPSIQTTTDETGAFALQIPAALGFGGIGLAASRTGYYSTYGFVLNVFENQTSIENLSLALYPIALVEEECSALNSGAGVVLDESKGMLGGEIAWVSGNQGAPVGCGVVGTEPFNGGTPGEGVYYVNNNYRPTDGLTETIRDNGSYWIVNAEPGETTLTASVAGVTKSVTTFVYAGGVTLNIVAFGGDAPPTPADCPDDLTSAVIDGNSQQPVSGATVQLLQATSGQPFSPAISAITATDGSFLLLVPPSVGLAGIEVSQTGYLSSYYWGPIGNMISAMESSGDTMEWH
jgi:hypothetical protein